jgi:hypothetical protein
MGRKRMSKEPMATVRSSSPARWRGWPIAMPIVVLVVCSLLVGIVIVRDYGQSTDEDMNVYFARQTLQSYQHPDRPYQDPSREDKGPFYLMVWVAVGEFLGRVVPGWVFADGRHMVNFVVFQAAVVSVYALSLRLVKPGTALVGAVLFETQPLLFGHAFINQKDTPFMALFAATVAIGLALVDRISHIANVAPAAPQPDHQRALLSWQAVRDAWSQVPRRGRRAARAVVAWLLIPIVALGVKGFLLDGAEAVVRAAYRGEAWPPINQLFLRFAEHTSQIPVEAYVKRVQGLTIGALALVTLVAALVVGIAALRRLLPLVSREVLPAVVREVRQGAKVRLMLPILPGAIVLGMAIAVRSSALFAGLLVSLYAILRLRLRGVASLTLYFAAAACVACALWPQLWGSVAGMFSASVEWALKYPEVHYVLFEGTTYPSNALPRWYLPELLAIQLTLPAVILILGSLGVAVRVMRRRCEASWVTILLLVWFFVPFLAVVVLRVPIYNYFRHLLFITPPLFVLATLAMEWVRRRVRPQLVQALLAGVIVLPGVVALVRLHPYEYGYFNELVGGVRGAYGQFISDYWCTSLREAMQYVNEYAPPSAEIAVSGGSAETSLKGPEDNAIPFARSDLSLRDATDMAVDQEFKPVLILGCGWTTIAQGFFPDAPIVWTVQREGVPLTIVKSLATPQPGVP